MINGFNVKIIVARICFLRSINRSYIVKKQIYGTNNECLLKARQKEMSKQHYSVLMCILNVIPLCFIHNCFSLLKVVAKS